MIKLLLHGLIKGEKAKTRPPETLKCSKSKTCISRKLKTHQSVYDMVSDKGWNLGARRHKINYNFFSIGNPPKKLW